MTDFVAMSQTPGWRQHPGPMRIGTVVQPPVYINAPDHITSDAQTSYAAEQKYMNNYVVGGPTSPTTVDLVGSALTWPYWAVKDKMATPFVTGALTATVTAPLYDQSIGIGAALLAGYVIGAVTFYAQSARMSKEPPKPADASSVVTGRPSLH